MIKPSKSIATKNKVETEEVNLTELTSAKYVKANLPEIAENCKDHTSDQKAKLLMVLMKHEELFQGKRGEWKGHPISIESVDKATPVWAKPYPVPLKNREVFKEEIYRQCSIGALRELPAEEIEERVWALPYFGVPKKNGTICLVMDFRQLNSSLKRKEYPLLTIDEIFQDIRGLAFASVIDVISRSLSPKRQRRSSQL